MEVEIFALCDAATTHAGKLNILGAFDTFFSPQTPLLTQACCLAARLRFLQFEEGQKALRLAFIDADGRAVVPTMDFSIRVAVGPNASSGIFDLVVQVPQIPLPRFGDYSIGLAIDGRSEKTIPLFARPVTSPTVPDAEVEEWNDSHG